MVILISAGTVGSNLASGHTAAQLVTRVALPEPRETTASLSLIHRQSALLPISPSGQEVITRKTANAQNVFLDSPATNPVASATGSSKTTLNQDRQPEEQTQLPLPKGDAHVQVFQTQAVCMQGQSVIPIASAQIVFQQPFSLSTTMTWYWETSIDSGSATIQSPIPTTHNSQLISMGQPATVTLTTSDASGLLQYAPESATYSYKLRLHALIDASDLVSDWINIPENAAICS